MLLVRFTVGRFLLRRWSSSVARTHLRLRKEDWIPEKERLRWLFWAFLPERLVGQRWIHFRVWIPHWPSLRLWQYPIMRQSPMLFKCPFITEFTKATVHGRIAVTDQETSPSGVSSSSPFWKRTWIKWNIYRHHLVLPFYRKSISCIRARFDVINLDIYGLVINVSRDYQGIYCRYLTRQFSCTLYYSVGWASSIRDLQWVDVDPFFISCRLLLFRSSTLKGCSGV